MWGPSASFVDQKYPRRELIDLETPKPLSRLSGGIERTSYSDYDQSLCKLRIQLDYFHSQCVSELTQRSVLPVPNSNGLIVGAGNDPRELMMEKDCANIVQMSIQRE